MSPNNILPTTINVLADLFIGQSMSPNVTRVHDRCPVGQLYLDLGSECAHRFVIDSQFCTCTRTMTWSQIVLAIVKLNNCNYICTLTWIQNMPTACYWFTIVLVLGQWHNTTSMVTNVFRLQIVLAIFTAFAFVLGPGSFEAEIDLHSWWCITIDT